MGNQSSNLRRRIVIGAVLGILAVLAFPELSFAAEKEYQPALYCTAWALLPPIVAIALALITKEVYSSLFLGIVVGAVLYAGGNFSMTMDHILSGGIIKQLSDPYNVGILVFLVILGIFVELMNKTGSSKAFGEWAERKIKTREGAQLATVGLGVLIFIDDYFNCLTVGSVMRPVTDKHNISRAKLAYLIDSTAAPICIIAPISSWAAAVSGFVPGEDGFQVFLRAIPYNFYAILTILMMILIITLRVDFGLMRKHEDNAILNNDLFTTEDRQYEDIQESMITGKGKVIDMIVPVIILIGFCVIGMIYSGGFFSGTSFIESFSNADASVGLSFGGTLALVFTFVWYIARRVLSFNECMGCISEGFKAMVAPVLILTFAWTLKGMTDSLGAADFVALQMKGVAGSLVNFLPAVIFLVAVGLAFATGTSWGTFGILIPIVVNLFASTDQTLMIISISACMAGAVCGDHCSPISDTTIMSSAGAQCNHINHVRTQIPYAMTVAAVSFVSYIIAGFARSALIGVPASLALLFVVVLILRKKYGAESKTSAEVA